MSAIGGEIWIRRQCKGTEEKRNEQSEYWAPIRIANTFKSFIQDLRIR